jgi:Tfp pilus assembly protein FimV
MLPTLFPQRWHASLACLMALGAVTSATGAASEAVPAASPPSVASPAATTYRPKAGETLDQVIAKTMPSSPLSMSILRQAFIDQNPQAIIAGKVPKLRKGATLNLPDHDLLLRGVLASVTPVAAQSETSPRPAPSTPEDRKRWVQFP